MSDPRYVLDASALLTLISGEPGTETVVALLPDACIGAVNLSEVVAKLVERGVPEDIVAESLAELGIDVRPFDETQAMATGLIRVATRHAGLSLGDRACLALAIALDAEAITTDAAWARVELPIRIRFAR